MIAIRVTHLDDNNSLSFSKKKKKKCFLGERRFSFELHILGSRIVPYISYFG